MPWSNLKWGTTKLYEFSVDELEELIWQQDSEIPDPSYAGLSVVEI